MPIFTITVEASTNPSLSIVGNIYVNTRQSSLPPPIYGDIAVHPTDPEPVHLKSGEYVMLFNIQNGSGDLKLSLQDDTSTTIASQSFRSPPQRRRVWYFEIR